MQEKVLNDESWNIEIHSKRNLFNLDLKELLNYKDLIFLFVKRDFISIYKQTVLGPLWIVIQPILTTVVFTIIFGNIAKIGTNGIPGTLFYLSGITVWSYFSDCVIKTSDTFIKNQNIFGKVYFPRLILPLSVVLTNLIKFGIQLGIFLGVYLYFVFLGSGEIEIHPTMGLLLIPVIVLSMLCFGLGTGLIISALTTKYKDLKFLIQFGIQLAMYATPIVYPINIVDEKYKWLILSNPMTSVIETFKYAFFGDAFAMNYGNLVYGIVVSIVVLFLGLFLFNRVERSFMDTI